MTTPTKRPTKLQVIFTRRLKKLRVPIECIKEHLENIPIAVHYVANMVSCFGQTKIILPLMNGKKELRLILRTQAITTMQLFIISIQKIKFGHWYTEKFL